MRECYVVVSNVARDLIVDSGVKSRSLDFARDDTFISQPTIPSASRAFV